MLVVAPHPDDETIGCGGLVALLKARGAQVSILFLTRGGGSLRSLGIDEAQVAEARCEQAIRAASALGLEPHNLTFWNITDGAIPIPEDRGFREAAANLQNLIGALHVEAVFCPHPLDGWGDHAAAALLVQHARAQQNHNQQLYYYLIWAWHNATWGMPGFDLRRALRLDINSVIPQKYAALDIYFHIEPSLAALPYCGNLPWSITGLARRAEEIFFVA
jgi:LmbE family N-acetylglucosaminyl deacetylase